MGPSMTCRRSNMPTATLQKLPKSPKRRTGRLGFRPTQRTASLPGRQWEKPRARGLSILLRVAVPKISSWANKKSSPRSRHWMNRGVSWKALARSPECWPTNRRSRNASWSYCGRKVCSSPVSFIPTTIRTAGGARRSCSSAWWTNGISAWIGARRSCGFVITLPGFPSSGCTANWTGCGTWAIG
ncbi:hypothetical protein HRbin36_01007 [bacterium HR36]|nr:hypothetical protein HRbin36_01007 [bacterium HR36]